MPSRWRRDLNDSEADRTLQLPRPNGGDRPISLQRFLGKAATSSEVSTTANSSTTSFLKNREPGPTLDVESPPQRRKFSFKNKKSIVILSILLVIILTIILATTLSLLLPRHRHFTRIHQPASPANKTDPLAFEFSTPPVRLGLLTNFPDPSIYFDNDTATWYALGTNDGAGILGGSNDVQSLINPYSNVQLATSPDFTTWTLQNASADPLPSLGAWVMQGAGTPDQIASATRNPAAPTATPSASSTPSAALLRLANVWAPSMFHNPHTDSWVMYYSAASASAPRHHCVGAARASAPTGPFTPLAAPLACPIDIGGAIDPAPFVDPLDENTIYVVYKVDGNSIGHGGECGNTVAPIQATPILLQRMLADGVTPDPEFAPVTIMDRTADDGPLVEAPALVKVDDLYYLFFSSGCTRQPDYDVKYATARNVTGPYTRAAAPLLQTGSFGLQAPGSVSVVYAADTAGGETYSKKTKGWKIAVHGRVDTDRGGVRAMFTAGLRFDGRGGVELVDE